VGRNERLKNNYAYCRAYNKNIFCDHQKTTYQALKIFCTRQFWFLANTHHTQNGILIVFI